MEVEDTSASSKKKSRSKKKLPPHLEEKRTRVTVGPVHPSDGGSFEYSGLFQSLGIDNSFDLEEFKENFKVNIISLSEDEAVFDVIGIDAPIANALRRIMISEVETMAIEHVYIYNNTSVMQDEVLAHRLGLIPIKADPKLFETRRKDEDVTDQNTITFTLNVTCTRNPEAPDDAPPQEKYINERVYSGDLKWKPEGSQDVVFAENPIAPVHKDILITKLRPGQSIELEARCEKGQGKTHAKWSPVSTASYRLLPEITLKQPVLNEEAEELVKLCPMKVFDIEDISSMKQAVVKRPRSCTMCRECIREPKWQEKVKLTRVKNHFIFSVESTGIIPAQTIFAESIRILIEKCTTLENCLQQLGSGSFNTEKKE